MPHHTEKRPEVEKIIVMVSEALIKQQRAIEEMQSELTQMTKTIEIYTLLVKQYLED